MSICRNVLVCELMSEDVSLHDHFPYVCFLFVPVHAGHAYVVIYVQKHMFQGLHILVCSPKGL